MHGPDARYVAAHLRKSFTDAAPTPEIWTDSELEKWLVDIVKSETFLRTVNPERDVLVSA